MIKRRLIARLDVKAPRLIKGVHLEGLRVVGDPNEYAVRYAEQGIDEILYIDCVASLYGRNGLADVVSRTVDECFVPVTVGGGLRSVEDVRTMLLAGADKTAINTAAVKRPELISEIAHKFGSQCMVLSIEAKRRGDRWEAYTDNGREPTGLDVVEWCIRGAELGAGEILLTSVDMEGTRKGYDLELVKAVTSSVQIPVIASGGMGKAQDLVDVFNSGADGAAMADCLHYNRIPLADIRNAAMEAGIQVRPLEVA